jgi:preprotein translocase subunit SecG
MLSFMREQGGSGSSSKQTKRSDQTDGHTSNDTAQEFLSVAANKNKLRKSTILVAILVAIGLVCLWFMIRKSQPESASAKQGDEEENRLEVAIGRLTGVSTEMVDKMDRIVKKFYEFSDVFQVKVSELVKDPFAVEIFAKDMSNQVVSNEDTAVLIREQRMKEQAATLQFLSVMQSADGNACMINDRILGEGDRVDNFVVTRIGGDFVLLTWQEGGGSGGAGSLTENMTIQLKLAQ